jgi:hypothetical protein
MLSRTTSPKGHSRSIEHGLEIVEGEAELRA